MSAEGDMEAVDLIRATVLFKHKYTIRTLKSSAESRDGVAVMLGQCQCGEEFEPSSSVGIDQQVTQHLSERIRDAFHGTNLEGTPGTGGLSELSR